MKNLFTTATALVTLALTSTITLAQNDPVEIGFHAGVNLSGARLSGLNITTPDVIKPRSGMGYSAGAQVSIPLSRSLAVVPGVDYARRSFQYDAGTSVDLFDFELPIGATLRSRTDFIDVPVKLQYAFGNGNVRGFVNAGPVASYALGTNIEARLNSFIDIPLASFDIGMGSAWTDRFQLGAVAGAGVTIDTGPGTLFFEGQYYQSFNNTYNIPLVDVGLRQHSFGVRIGYAIPIGGKKTQWKS